MTHPEELLAGYVSGSLAASDIAKVDEHLADCETCSAEVLSARTARSALGSLPEVSAPAGIASRALEAAAEGGRPGWHRWLGVGAAAAVVALVLVSLPHLGSAPASQEKAGSTSLGGIPSSATISDTAGLHLVVQGTNYNQAALDALTSATAQKAASTSEIASAGIAPSAAPQERAGTSAELQTAVACIGKAVPAKAGTPFKLILARFNGSAVFLAFYFHALGDGQPPTSVVVWIVDGHTCTASGLSSMRI